MITVLLTVQNSLTALVSVWSLAPLKSRKRISYACVFCVFEVLNMCVCLIPVCILWPSSFAWLLLSLHVQRTFTTTGNLCSVWGLVTTCLKNN